MRQDRHLKPLQQTNKLYRAAVEFCGVPDHDKHEMHSETSKHLQWFYVNIRSGKAEQIGFLECPLMLGSSQKGPCLWSPIYSADFGQISSYDRHFSTLKLIKTHGKLNAHELSSLKRWHAEI